MTRRLIGGNPIYESFDSKSTRRVVDNADVNLCDTA